MVEAYCYFLLLAQLADNDSVYVCFWSMKFIPG